MTGSSGVGDYVSHRLRRLDARLGIDHNGHSEWVWAVPAFILVATLAGFEVIGQITSAGALVATPVGAVIAVVMAGLAVAYMTPTADDAPGDPPPELGTDTPLGSPGGPWVVMEHLASRPHPGSEHAPAAPDRELVGASGAPRDEDVRAAGARGLAPPRIREIRRS